MDYEDLFLQQLNNHYCSSKELQYSSKNNYFLSLKELNDYYTFKDNISDDYDKKFVKLNLKTFNSKNIYFSNCLELSQLFLNFNDLLNVDINYSEILSIKNMSEIYKSRIYSEVEGSLGVEDVPTTRKRFNELVIKGMMPENNNDQIIKNMANGIEFVLSKPEFNKDNLHKLYSILSYNSLDDNHRLKDEEYYRYDDVYIDKYEGCPVDEIDECMNSLFEFVNLNIKKNGIIQFYLPHIVHYYILYIHPYFDYNGRTARMVSLWIHLLLNNLYPPFISDGINQTKNRYYKNLEESRNQHNDITFFLMYIMNVSINYYLTYLNIENISSKLKNNGITLTNLEKDYLKKILISESGAFTYKDFILWCRIDITKQGAFKALNKFVEYNVLEEIKTTNNKKLFKVKNENITYLNKTIF